MDDPAQTIIAYTMVLLLILTLISMGVGKIQEWLRRPRLMSRPAPPPPPDPVVAHAVAPAPAWPVAPVATPQNGRNAGLRVAEDATISALAALIMESRRKPFQNGEVPETRALKVLFGVSPSSDPRSEYQRLRALLRADLARLDTPPPYPPLSPDQAETRAALGLDRP